MKKIAILQSSYIPWKGYFDIIHDVDLFLYFDDVQFTPRDWRSRNRIKTPQGLHWLTVPTGSDRNRRICDVILTDMEWGRKHWENLRHHYGKAPYFQSYRGFLEDVYLGRRWESLSELNQYLTTKISQDFLGTKTEFHDSRNYRGEGQKQELILDLVKKSGAGLYLSGPSAKNYIEPSRFDEIGVQLVFKSYEGYPEYPQLYSPFEHAVTILDLLFQTGPDAPWYIWGWRDGSLAS